MKPTRVIRSKRWLGASAMAIIVALGAGAAVTLQSYPAAAQVSVKPNTTTIPSSFADLVQAVKPAVVSIAVEGTEPVPQMSSGPDFFFNFPDLPDGHPLKKFFQEFGDQGQNGQPQKRRSQRFEAAGSGFVISADGYVVTNNHVVKDAKKITVITSHGTQYPAEVVGTDPRTDLALIKIKGAKDMPYVQFADTEARVGDWVIAVGNPFGLGGTVTAGIVSARGRDISGSATGDFLQIDAAVNRGNSGGPDFNMQGKVVGVNTAIFSPNGGNVGIAFAIPASIAKQIVHDLKTKGTVVRGFLGVSIQDLTQDIADSVGLPNDHGAVVTQPTPDSPAAKAGLKSGDIILAVDGEDITNALDLSRTIAGKAPGTDVTITYWRDGKKTDVKIKLAKLDEAQLKTQDKAQPQQQAEPQSVSVDGLTLVPNADGKGLLIQSIDPDSNAATKGLAVGDLIVEADNKPMVQPEDFQKAVDAVKKSGRTTILIKASRNGTVRFVGLPLTQSK